MWASTKKKMTGTAMRAGEADQRRQSRCAGLAKAVCNSARNSSAAIRPPATQTAAAPLATI